MNFNHLLLSLRARYKVVALALILTVFAAVFVSLILPKTYVANTALVVNYKGVDPVTGLTLPAQLMPGYLATQIDIIKSKSVALKVVDALKLADSVEIQKNFQNATKGEGTIRDWLADLLLSKVDVAPARESNVLNISFKGNDPQFVALVVNAFAAAYLEFSVQLKTDPAVQATSNIIAQVKVLREQYEEAQKKLSKYQQEHNIYSADNRLDVETARLNEISSQLVQVQSVAIEANSRGRQVQGNAGESPDVLNNSLVQGLKSNLAIAEAKFAETSQKVAPNHPQYIAAKSEVDKLRSSLNEQIRATSSGIVSNVKISQQRESELLSALAAQKSKVLALNVARDEFNVLTNEMENAKRAYETASQRLNQTSFESQSKQADIAVLTAATAPRAPAGPKLLLNTALSVVVGLIIGVGVALLLELIDLRVRSADVLAEVFPFPVLGIIDAAHAHPHKQTYANLPYPSDGSGTVSST